MPQLTWSHYGIYVINTNYVKVENVRLKLVDLKIKCQDSLLSDKFQSLPEKEVKEPI